MKAFPQENYLVCGYGGIGRRDGFRCHWATVQVRVLLSASDYDDSSPVPSGNGLGFFVV